MVILSTRMAMKGAGITPWVHHTQVKKVEATDAGKLTMDSLKLGFHCIPGPFYNFLLSLLLRLMSDMNNDYGPTSATLRSRLETEEDRYREGISKCDYRPATQNIRYVPNETLFKNHNLKASMLLELIIHVSVL